ncbi:MAG: pseudouridine synthase, partial [Leptospirales bacterium]
MTKVPPPEFPDDANDEPGKGVRLQKLIAHRGLASRRNAEIMIQGGLVRINGEIVTVPGTKVDPLHDQVSVEGRPVPVEPEPFLFLFYKPKGVVSTLHDPDGKTTLKEFFPQINPLIHIGRLDLQSEGVLLLTNNGDLAQRILHPRFAIPRTYLVKVQGVVSPHHLERLQTGKVKLDGHPVLPVELALERLTQTNAWYRISLTEGRNREIRRLFEVLGYFVLKLTRISFGTLDLNGLEPGEYRLVSPAEIETLLSGAGRKKNVPSSPSAKPFPTDSPSRSNRRPPQHGNREDRGPREFSDRPSRPSGPRDNDSRRDSSFSRDSRPPQHGNREDRGPREFSDRPSRPSGPRDNDSRRDSSFSRDSRPPQHGNREDRGPREFSDRPSR